MKTTDLAQATLAVRPDLAGRARKLAVDRLQAYQAELTRYARRLHLVAPGDLPFFRERHILPALALIPQILLYPHAAIVDVGSGAGLPGIPLAICLPESRLTLIEVRRRRAHFLRHCVRALPLSNVETLHCRVEDLPPEGTADILLSRAVGGLAQLQRAALGLLAPHGVLLATQPSTAGQVEEHDHQCRVSTASIHMTVATRYRASCG